VGGKITFEDVLAVGTDEKQLLTGPDAAKAKVVGKIIAQGRHPKITVLKFKTCGQYKISRGHRQNYTAVQVSGIELYELQSGAGSAWSPSEKGIALWHIRRVAAPP